jgi:hypothetical protein
MRSVPILWLDENFAGLWAIEPRRLGKEECIDEVIEKSTDFWSWHEENPLARANHVEGSRP